MGGRVKEAMKKKKRWKKRMLGDLWGGWCSPLEKQEGERSCR